MPKPQSVGGQSDSIRLWCDDRGDRGCRKVECQAEATTLMRVYGHLQRTAEPICAFAHSWT